MSIELIGDRRDRDKLGIVHEKFLKGEVTSFVCVAVYADGQTEVNYDLHDSREVALLNKMGGGLLAALDALRNMATEAQIKANIMRGQNPFATN